MQIKRLVNVNEKGINVKVIADVNFFVCFSFVIIIFNILHLCI